MWNVTKFLAISFPFFKNYMFILNFWLDPKLAKENQLKEFKYYFRTFKIKKRLGFPSRFGIFKFIIITLLIPPSREEEVYFTACLKTDVDFVPFEIFKK